MANDRRLLFGLITGALVPSVVFSMCSPGLGADLAHPGSVAMLSALLYLPSLAATLILGLPLFYLLQKLEIVRWWSVAGAGFVGGGISCAAFTDFRFMSQDIPAFVLWAGVGASTALVCWVVWRYGAAQPTVQGPTSPPSAGPRP